jgi:hypothetical protein
LKAFSAQLLHFLFVSGGVAGLPRAGAGLAAFLAQLLQFLFEGAGFGIRLPGGKPGFGEGAFGFFGGLTGPPGFAFGQLEPGFGLAGFALGGASGSARLSGFLFKTPRLSAGGGGGLFQCFEFHGLVFSFHVSGGCADLRGNFPELAGVLQDPNDRGMTRKMSNDEIRMTIQCPNDQMTKWMPDILPPLVKFVIGASSLFRHSCFDIRHPFVAGSCCGTKVEN